MRKVRGHSQAAFNKLFAEFSERCVASGSHRREGVHLRINVEEETEEARQRLQTQRLLGYTPEQVKEAAKAYCMGHQCYSWGVPACNFVRTNGCFGDKHVGVKLNVHYFPDVVTFLASEHYL